MCAEARREFAGTSVVEYHHCLFDWHCFAAVANTSISLNAKRSVRDHRSRRSVRSHSYRHNIMREPTAYYIDEERHGIDPFNRRHINLRFKEVVAQLGPEGKHTWGFFWTIRPKNDHASWDRCNAIAEGVNKKLTRALWRRKGQYQQLRSIRAIETKDMRDHVHGITLVDIDDLKQYWEQQDVADMISAIAYSFNEVNEKHKYNLSPPVSVEQFVYFDDPTNKSSGHQAGQYIKYMCKTATHTNNPLA